MNQILSLVGPTGSGKTEIALEISRHLSVEVISCDSMQAYKRMPITTQTPSRNILREVKTHLISFLEPSQEYNAAIFREKALASAEKILKKNKTPLIVGGTGLYLRALLDGLFPVEGESPSRDEGIRKRLIEEEKMEGPGQLHRKLEVVDPLSAKKIHPNDHRRLVRALEVFYLTGKPISHLKPKREGIRNKWVHRIFMLDRNRKDLYERINDRVEKMFKEGLVQEVKELSKKGLGQTARMALGIREVSAYLQGSLTLEQSTELLKKNTRNYAKRQLSWFRHERGVEPVPIAANESPREVAQKILERL